MGLAENIQEFGVQISLAFDSKKAEIAHEKIQKLGSELKSLSIGVAAAAAGVFEMGNLFSSNARSLSDQSAILGITTDQLQEFEYAAKVAANVTRDDLVSSLQTLGSTLDKARAGDVDSRNSLMQMAAAGHMESKMLQIIGDRTYNVTDAMQDLSAGIADVYKTSPQAAARLSEMAFGSSKLIPLLKQGPKGFKELRSEAEKNWVMTQKQIEAGKQMDVQFTKIWMTFKKLGYEIGEKVLVHIKPMVAQFEKWFRANKALIGVAINTFLDKMADVLKVVFELLQETGSVLGPLIEKVGGMKEAVKLLVDAFLIFKAIQIGTVFAQAVIALVGLLPIITSIASALGGVMLSLSGWAAILVGLPAAVHDIYSMLYEGKPFKETWIGQGIDYIEQMLMKLGILKESLHIDTAIGEGAFNLLEKGKARIGEVFGEANRAQRTADSPKINNPGEGVLAGGGDQNQFTMNLNVMVPPGTSPTAASNLISNAAITTQERLLLKAKQDSNRKRVY